MTKKTIAQKAEESKIKQNNLVGPEKFSRDDNGLLKAVRYEFNEDGSVDWRAMIREEHLFPNRSWFNARKKDMPSSIDGLKDHQLLIKLSGIKELAKLRGFNSVSYCTEKCEYDHVAVSCTVNWVGNFETGGNSVTFSDMANATLNNTSSFATKFLETIACNRAFVRCVRNFLNVHIVGDDEIDKSSLGPPTAESLTSIGSLGIDPISILSNQFKTDFNGFKEKLRILWEQDVYKNIEAKNWNDFSDIPPKEARILLNALKSS